MHERTPMKTSFVLILALLLLLGGTDAARALTTIPRDFDELVARADTVFKGTVSAQTSQWVGQNENRHIVTFVTFQVEETYKGTPAGTQTLRFLGGTVGNDAMEVPDLPKFTVGQKAVLFVVNNGKQFCPLVGITQGRFRVVTEAATGRERVFTEDGSPVVNTAEIGKVDAAAAPRLKRDAGTGAAPITADDFRSQILGKVAALPR